MVVCGVDRGRRSGHVAESRVARVGSRREPSMDGPLSRRRGLGHGDHTPAGDIASDVASASGLMRQGYCAPLDDATWRRSVVSKLSILGRPSGLEERRTRRLIDRKVGICVLFDELGGSIVQISGFLNNRRFHVLDIARYESGGLRRTIFDFAKVARASARGRPKRRHLEAKSEDNKKSEREEHDSRRQEEMPTVIPEALMPRRATVENMTTHSAPILRAARHALKAVNAVIKRLCVYALCRVYSTRNAL